MKMNNKKRGLAICLIAMLMIMMAAGTSGGQNAEAKAKPVLNKKKVSLAVGGKVTLKLKNWKKRVTWSSSKKSVATVSGKGVVKAKKKGTAKITAKAGGKKYVCRVTVTKTSGYAAEVLKLVNKERKKHGLSALTLDEKLCRAADKRAKETVSLFSHTRPDGTSCFTILEEYGIGYRSVGENIAAGQRTAKDVVASWMNSPGHRANILSSSYEKLGVGLVKASSGYGYYWVQLFVGGMNSKKTSVSKSPVATSRPVATRKPTAAPTRTPIVMPTPVPPAGTTVRPSAKPVQSPGSEANYAQQVLVLVNAARAEEGLSPLVLDPAICAAANVRAQEIIGTFSHTRPNGTSCFTVLGEFGISYMATGENIAAGQSTPEAVMTAWMNSPGHRANILSSSFRKLGVGFVKSENGYKYYWTQLFTG